MKKMFIFLMVSFMFLFNSKASFSEGKRSYAYKKAVITNVYQTKTMKNNEESGYALTPEAQELKENGSNSDISSCPGKPNACNESECLDYGYIWNSETNYCRSYEEICNSYNNGITGNWEIPTENTSNGIKTCVCNEGYVIHGDYSIGFYCAAPEQVYDCDTVLSDIQTALSFESQYLSALADLKDEKEDLNGASNKANKKAKNAKTASIITGITAGASTATATFSLIRNSRTKKCLCGASYRANNRDRCIRVLPSGKWDTVGNWTQFPTITTEGKSLKMDQATIDAGCK